MTHHYTQFVCRPWIILHAANVPSQSSPRILHMTNKTRINTIKLPRLTLQHHRPLSTQIEHLHHDYMLTLQLFPTSQSLPPSTTPIPSCNPHMYTNPHFVLSLARLCSDSIPSSRLMFSENFGNSPSYAG